MEFLKNFFECYFNQSADFDDLEWILKRINLNKNYEYKLQLIIELHQIIQTKNYKLASRIADKYGDKDLNLGQSEQLIKYIFNNLTDQPAYINRSDFVKDCKVVLCPICCPDPETLTTAVNLIQKATIISKNIQIYICKPCKLAWPTEDIRADNAKNYKKFMKKIGLKGFWTELSNIDTL